MTDQPQPLDLDAIEASANAATPGPWFTHGGWPGRVFSDDEFNAHIARVTGTRANASAEFIAAARTDVPALLAAIRRLTAERDRYRDAWRNARTRARDSAADESMWRRIVTSTEQGRDRVIADNDSLRAELQQARQQNAHDPIECDHQAEAGQLAEQVKRLRAALSCIESDAEHAAREGDDLNAVSGD